VEDGATVASTTIPASCSAARVHASETVCPRGGAQGIDGVRGSYRLERAGAVTALDDLQWADFDARGRLLAATRDGRLQVREFDGRGFRVVEEHDLRPLRPDPAPPPAWAGRWGS
jgi:hypothetical protein